MKKFLPAVAKALLLLSLLAGLLLALITAFISTDQLEYQLVRWVKQETGKDLRINGSFAWRLFPQAHISASDVRLTGERDMDFLTFQQLEIRTDLWSVFQQGFTVEEILLNGLTLDVKRDRQGNINWRQNAAAEHKEIATAPLTLNLPVQRLQLSNARIDFNDQQNEQHFVTSDIQFTLQQLAAQKGAQQFAVSASAQLAESSKNLQLSIDIKSELQLASALKVSAMEITLLLDSPEKEAPLDLTLAGELLFQPELQSLSSKGFTLESQLLNLQAVLNTNLVAAGKSRLDISINSLNPARVLDYLPIADMPPLPENLWRNLSGDLEITFDPVLLRTQAVSVRLDDSQLQGEIVYDKQKHSVTSQFKIDEIPAKPYLALWQSLPDRLESTSPQSSMLLSSSIQVNNIIFPQGRVEELVNKTEIRAGQLVSSSGAIRFRELGMRPLLGDVEQLHDFLQLDNKQLFQKLDGHLSYDYSDNRIQLDDIDLRLDKSHISGKLGYQQQPASVDVQLQLDQLDLDSYLKDLPQADAERTDNPTPFAPFEFLQQLKGHGQIDVGYLKFRDTEYRGISIEMAE